MKTEGNIPLVRTIKEHCRVCYTCVRECPVKAIRIADGQAEVLPERCVGCGNCVRVCSQHAKDVLSDIDNVNGLLRGAAKVAAILAPSFAAEFPDIEAPRLIGILRAMGFAYVNEVAFGADLVAARYRRLLNTNDGQRYIATTCPAIVGFIERYHPTLVASLAPIVSPMVAEARALRRLHGADLKVVFIGPCIAKKGEARSENGEGDIDAALTFVELRRMILARDLISHGTVPGDFDAPHAGAGALFAVSRGMLQAAGIEEDLAAGNVIAAEGRSDFVEAIKEFEAGDLDAKLLEVLCCNGCIMGAGMSCDAPLFSRRSRVAGHVRRRMSALDWDQWRDNMERLADLDLNRRYKPNDQRIPVPSEGELAMILADMGKVNSQDELNCGACGYETCREHAIAIFEGLAECEMCLPYTIDQLRKAIKELGTTNEQLASAQEALMQSEKLASMGQLAAGIAHEVNNPLGVVLMFSHLLMDDLGADSKHREDLVTIVQHADRCKKIVAGLLHFARQNKVQLAMTNIRELVDKSLRVLQVAPGITLRAEHEAQEAPAEVDRDQITQILNNLVNNAAAAMPEGGTITVRTSCNDAHVRFSVSDTGVGIPEENRKKIFDPFFTTKAAGKGTGLGLAVTYGIVKMHRGDIRVESNADAAIGPTGTTFTVTLPRQALKNGHNDGKPDESVKPS